jgi:hypothetical protein
VEDYSTTMVDLRLLDLDTLYQLKIQTNEKNIIAVNALGLLGISKRKM